MKIKNLVIVFVLAFCSANAQEEIIRNDSLKELVITSSRIDLPFKENSRTIQIITASDIKNLGVTNIADALQQIAGVDVRRQGINGMQADLYIRGGSFDQTLLLIDGIKVDDPQTGHHTLNMALPVTVIKRIEIIKGPAARIFGQNAFTGAVNIVTKDGVDNSLSAKIQAGSFHQFLGEVLGTIEKENSSHILQVSKHFSEGYRENTDFDNTNVFTKSTFNKSKLPITLLTSYNERKFGANGFYGIPTATQQYEETQASLLGVSTEIKKGNITWKPRIYWRRNQDEYIYIRNNPSIYRNLHITNKIAAELNGSYQSKIGTTGFGLELSKYYISSNNLGNNNREIATLFLEHRFQFFNNKFDITPGIAASYFSDFDNKIFPGIDLGYKVSENVNLYANIGYTYRVPTYTDLYYIGPQAVGNKDLQAEDALSEEVGVKLNLSNIDLTIAGFNRDSNDLIDYVRINATDMIFTPRNIQDVTTKGFETQVDYRFALNGLPHKLHFGYTFIEDEVKKTAVAESRYSINSLKHQFVANYTMNWFTNFSTTIAYRYTERTLGTSYNLYDCTISYNYKNARFTMYANNIFNTEYFETNNLPMPKGNVLFGFQYNFR
ncbi:TonB-dependent receptor plug domain-containing protein [Flavobacterium sp.]|uniref:TonB-dependent receptor plug domain-containing protein n=1 Tax=Flavobacterium sp. TaxID=239 RepID=UPI0035294243